MKKNVLITGAAKGLGAAIALAFASKGYNIILNYLNSKNKAIELRKKIIKLYNVRVLLIKADISSEKDVDNIVKVIKKEFNSLDILINNAVYENNKEYLDLTKNDFMKSLEVNVFGTFLITTKVSSVMKKNGVVLNISSLDTKNTYNKYEIDYVASKAGVNSLTKTLSLAIPNLKHITILLPWIDTESVKQMNQKFLKNELKRNKQKNLLNKEKVADKIWEIVNDDIKSGTILEMDDNYEYR